MKQRIMRIILYYIMGFVVFSVILSLSQLIVLGILGQTGDFMIILSNNCNKIFKTYTILYVLLSVALYVYDKIIIKKLNDNLNKTRKGNQ